MPVGLVAAGVGAAGAVAGAVISGNAAKSAANTEASAANNATAVQQQQFDQTTTNNKPFLTTGTSALNELGQIYGLDTVGADGTTTPGTAQPKLDPNATFYQSPDYNFDLTQGIRGVDAGAAARGGLDSGATRKAEIAYAGNLASGQFNNYTARLTQLAGVGQGAANSSATAGQNFANTYSNTVTNAANDQANIGLAGSAATSNQINNLIGNLTASGAFKSSYGTPGPVTATPQVWGSGI